MSTHSAEELFFWDTPQKKREEKTNQCSAAFFDHDLFRIPARDLKGVLASCALNS